MYKVTILLLLIISIPATIFSQTKCNTTMNYGENIQVGNYAKVNGIKIYYEIYGDTSKQPLLLIHGNGGSINSERCQIEYFKDKYKVIIADSRFHGKSENGSLDLTYDLMADDYKLFLDHLKIDSANIIGQSDGAIIGLIIAMKYPNKVKKLIATSPNLRPDNSAIHQWDIDGVSRDLINVEKQISEGNSSPEIIREKAYLKLMDKYPNIKNEELSKITSPVLVMAGDEDVIKLEHILEIYQNIKNAQLFIMPGATHFMLRSEHELFNQICARFLDNPFTRPTTKEIIEKK